MKRFDYDTMVHKALLGIVVDVLKHVEKEGLPGSNHFYVTFRTDRPDVVIPDELRKQHPEEVTIVLQHQFWDLKVLEHGFEVVLSFDERYEKITVPLSALISFLDPSANFGLQFIPEWEDENANEAEEGQPSTPYQKTSDDQGENNIISLDSFRKK